ncbi:MAG: OmpA family protein [Nitrospira sp.]|nr:OmpA family protein [Nitrospira sp.]MDH4357825.1 OmpA family protein [Nitrospira sp.]MDH5320329.1 OmpA family protein [Nitrospira sp.]
MIFSALALLSTVTLFSENAAGIAAVFPATSDSSTGDQVALHLYPVRDDSSSQKKSPSPIQATKGEKPKQQQPRAKEKEPNADKQRLTQKEPQHNDSAGDQSNSESISPQELSALRSSLQEAKQQIEELERELAVSNLEHAKRWIGKLEQRLSAKDQEIATLRSTVEDGSKLKSDLATQTEQLTQATTRVSELEQQLSGKEQELTKTKDELQQVTQTIEELTPQLTARTEELAQAKRSISDLERKLSKQEETARAPEATSDDSSPSAELPPDEELSVTNLLPHKSTRTDLPDSSEGELAKASQTLSSILGDAIKKGRVALEQRRNRLTLTLASGQLFASGEATMTPEGASLIEQIGTILQKFSYQSIEVAGHTDSIPVKNDPQRTFRDNGELSQARAEHASQALINGGVEGDRVKAVGYADTRPIATNETRKGRSKNRRVEIVVSSNASAGPTAHVQSQSGQKTTQPVSLSSPHKP